MLFDDSAETRYTCYCDGLHSGLGRLRRLYVDNLTPSQLTCVYTRYFDITLDAIWLPSQGRQRLDIYLLTILGRQYVTIDRPP